MRRLTAALLLASVSVGMPVSAQEASNPPETEGPAVITPMQKGQPAPFSGILFSPRAAGGVGAEIASIPDLLRIEVEKAVKEAEARKDYAYNELNTVCTSDRTQLGARIEANQRRIEKLTKDLQDAEDAAPNRGVWFGIGAVVGVGLTLGTVFVVIEATK